MFYTYVLKSLSTGRHYYGSTSDIKKRLKYHNSGKVRSTKAYRPWEIIYYEIFETKTEAMKRELFFKSIDGYNWLNAAVLRR
jgi:putative endonuclease